MAKKYYVVWQGKTPGIYDSWPKVQAQTQGQAKAQFMGFESKEEAEKAYAGSYHQALNKRNKSTSKTGSAAKSSGSKSNNSKTIAHADIDIYCDGACSPNPGKSGTGVAIYYKKEIKQLYYGLYDANGTNNTAELNGMLKAFEVASYYLKQGLTVQILSDSKYSIDCLTKWAKGWKNKGWKKATGEPIKNLELIQTCYQHYEKLQNDITITHVRGHADIEGNELSDRMAVLARNSKETDFVRYDQPIDIKTILAMPSG